MANFIESRKMKVSFSRKIIVKFGKSIAKSFPHNSVRKWGLRISGFNIGKQVYIGPDLIIASMISESTCYLNIGDRVAIGPRVTLVLSSDANWSKLMEKIAPVRSFISLEHDCWIGAGVIILPGITIGHSSIVGAGSVVTKDVQPNTVVAGMPAKLIRRIN